jgi:hypothetical protein
MKVLSWVIEGGTAFALESGHGTSSNYSETADSEQQTVNLAFVPGAVKLLCN